MLSRNFRLQKVGDLDWLQKNYNFSKISFFIDELIVLDVTRGQRDEYAFLHTLEALTEGCFVPIAAGGRLRSVDGAKRLLRSGADKIVVNTPIFYQPELINELKKEFGQQSIVGSLDLKRSSGGDYKVLVESGSRELDRTAFDHLRKIHDGFVGEWYLNSVDQDGTGQGYDFNILGQLPEHWTAPIILAGGAGNVKHLAAGLLDSRVDAVATANLFNFIGDGLKLAREALLLAREDLASWPPVSSLFEDCHPRKYNS